jgi:carboxyl-terminal processing protease
MIFVTGAFFGMGLMFFVFQLWGPGRDSDLQHYREVRDLVLSTYVGEVTEEELLESSLRGMLGELDDYSQYYVQEETDRLDIDTSGHTVGIGVIVRDLDGPVVLFPVEGSPAARAGVRVGDRLLEVDGTDTEGLPAEEVSALMRGEPGSRLALRVRGLDGGERRLAIDREELLVPSVRRVRLVDEGLGIGYLALTQFTGESAEEVDRAIADLESRGMRGLVLDLRGNSGGVLRAAVEIARRFVPEGLITSTEGRGEPRLEEADPEAARLAGMPLVVLVDGLSASASEVLAGALQDHRAAVLVGTPTFGKGLVQTISRYPGRRAIAKLTTSYYYTPAHRNLQRGTAPGSDHGLVPDVTVELDADTQRKVVRFLLAFEPPASVLPELRAWAEREDLGLELDPPRDPQLATALELLAGRRPEVTLHD